MFEEWWIHEVMVESPLGLAGDGSRTLIWGNRRVVKCHVRAGQRKVLGADGEVVMATHTIRCGEAIDVKDRIWLPGTTVGDAAQARRPALVTSAEDLDGHTLWRVEL